MSAPYSESIRARANELYKPGVYGVSRVARDLGVSNTTVRRWVDPGFAESSRRLARENKKRYRGTCVDCGASTAYSGVRSLGSDRCQACSRRYQHENRRWTAEAVVAAIRLFVERNGRPPVSSEWARADRGCDYPCVNAVARSGGWRSAPFATWNDALTAAGCPAYAPGCYPRTAETRARMSAAQRARQERERAERGRG